ncbi:hypothetical protein [Mesoplasma lactucae]|uniref:Uncharacterized protein n=1 Tax=Mesoplasma lactucae ATCC 49193 TaxID=81460 RepID=A0A291IQT2_9MOLU|nr:hypothetical protein [Mesoplasma lactucae]ATG97295.1 hypothetical protein CP520_00785 [Mesoplasma lactucae ATCC 49193]ATZ20255.1 hypothetical protein MLACT_v1c04340 [Mesoplasma lactucae ATCC 49193]MCL8216426.1 hypothetical protein [Mesoplasma lactucae ATCC 49193]
MTKRLLSTLTALIVAPVLTTSVVSCSRENHNELRLNFEGETRTKLSYSKALEYNLIAYNEEKQEYELSHPNETKSDFDKNVTIVFELNDKTENEILVKLENTDKTFKHVLMFTLNQTKLKVMNFTSD